MRVTTITTWPRILSALVLLVLPPVYASAQNFPPNKWYEVSAEQLSVRNKPKQLVIGTLRDATQTGQADRFYIYFWRSGLTYAWGYADGADFKGCGWVGVKSKRIKKPGFNRNLVPASSQPSPPGRCENFRTPINPSTFAQSIPQRFTPRSKGRQYTNLSPKDDGSGASVVNPTDVFGNYSVSGGAKTKLRRLTSGYVRWRYFTRDQKYVMVGVGSSRNRRGRSFGDWGFVRCKDIKPHPKDKKDAALFYDMCK